MKLSGGNIVSLCRLYLSREPAQIDVFTTVRLNVEENQLVNAFGEFGICLGGLKGA